MQTPHVVPSGSGNDDVPLMGTLESKFYQDNEPKQGIQFSKLKQKKKKKQQNLPTQAPTQPLTQPQQSQPQLQKPQPDLKKKKKKKKKKKLPEMVGPLPQTPSASAKKKVSFSPRVVSTVAYTYSKQEYDRTPIMGIFNHFCDACMLGIEGARFHCNLCENFDMCQECFVTQGAKHIHGQESFSCPELDELDQEENEGDEGDYDLFNEYLASLGAEGEIDEGDEEEDTSLDGLTFRFADEDDNVDTEMSSVCLADENGPLERITSQDAASLEEVDEDTPISMLFPKTAASTPVVANTQKNLQKEKNQVPLVLPQEKQKADSNTSIEAISKKPKKKKSAQPSVSLPKQSNPPQFKQPENGASTQPSKRKQSSTVKAPGSVATAGDVNEDEPLRVMLQKISTSPSASPKKFVHVEAAQKGNRLPETVAGLPQLGSMPASDPKKRARAPAPSPKVKKQKLTERNLGSFA